jgi:hypothetical protein
MPTDDDPEQQSGEEPADEPAAQSDAVAGNDQPDEQSTEGTDQVEQQSEDQPSSEADQQTGQADATLSDEADQPTEQPVQVAEAGGAQADKGDGGASGAADDVASNTVAAGGGAGATKVSSSNLKVIAEFTEEGQKFIGDILIHVFESDNGQQGRLLFPTSGQFWQNTVQKGNVITTPTLRVTTSEVLVFAHARVLLPNGDYQTMDTQDFKIPMPSGDTLQIKFDVGVGEIEKTINAPDADKAKAIAIQSPQLKGHYVLPPGLDAQPAGNQQFRVTGKFLSGDISLL